MGLRNRGQRKAGKEDSPSRMAGMHPSCTGVGCFNPSCRHCSTSHDDSPSSANPAMLRTGTLNLMMDTSGARMLRHGTLARSRLGKLRN